MSPTDKSSSPSDKSDTITNTPPADRQTPRTSMMGFTDSSMGTQMETPPTRNSRGGLRNRPGLSLRGGPFQDDGNESWSECSDEEYTAGQLEESTGRFEVLTGAEAIPRSLQGASENLTQENEGERFQTNQNALKLHRAATWADMPQQNASSTSLTTKVAEVLINVRDTAVEAAFELYGLSGSRKDLASGSDLTRKT